MLTRSKSADDLPHQVHDVIEFLKSCRTPATLSIVFRVLKCLAGTRMTYRDRCQNIMLTQLQQDPRQLRDSVTTMTPSIEELYQITQQRHPTSTLECAEIYRSVIYLFKCTLDWQPIESSRRFMARFDESDAEIMRYLMACNILQVRFVAILLRRSESRRVRKKMWNTFFDMLVDGCRKH